jgi:ferrous iron transport protein B
LTLEAEEPLQVATSRRLTAVLLGNPNVGKTTLFNSLSGLRFKVGNYPGVTVEQRNAVVEFAEGSVQLVDLPGVYSIEGQTEDEKITEAAISGSGGLSMPDVVLCVVDVTCLERQLFLVSEALATGLPVLVILTMSDVAIRRGGRIRKALLSRHLGAPIVTFHRDRKRNIQQLGAAVFALVLTKRSAEHQRHKSLSPEARYAWAQKVASECVVGEGGSPDSATFDRILLHPIGGVLTLGVVLFLVFQCLFRLSSPVTDVLEALISWVSACLQQLAPPGPLLSVVSEGIIGGCGSVLVFVPQIGILFFLLMLLEESGYLVRAAYVMDSLMCRIGLQGRAFIPLVSSFACAVPGIMATRTVPCLGDRIRTILVAPLMSCSARLPVYAVLISATVPSSSYGGISLQGLVLLGLYALGVMGAILISCILKRCMPVSDASFLVMELPSLRLPSVRVAAIHAYDRARQFVKSTGPIILASAILLWALSSFPSGDPQHSYAGMIGRAVQPLFSPMHYSWEICVALLASVAAREVFVSSLATVLMAQGSDNQRLAAILSGSQGFSAPVGVSLMVFFVFACQCVSTIAVVRKETGSWLWSALMVAYMTVMAWLSAAFTYRVVTWVVG